MALIALPSRCIGDDQGCWMEISGLTWSDGGSRLDGHDRLDDDRSREESRSLSTYLIMLLLTALERRGIHLVLPHIDSFVSHDPARAQSTVSIY